MTLEQIFEKCQKISVGKRHDYTTGSNRNENFHRSAMIVSWFDKARDKPYAALIATKIARLGSLLSREESPNFESIEDNFADIINYFALWLEDITENNLKPKEIETLENHPYVPDTVVLGFCICGQHSSRHLSCRSERTK